MKISRPVIYLAVASVVGYAAFVYLTPPTVLKKNLNSKVSQNQAKNMDGILPEDYDLTFQGVVALDRDIFKPLIVRTTNMDNQGDRTFGQGGWRLTGITMLDGKRNALLESANGDLASLSLGQVWEGYLVTAINETDVTLKTPDGKREKLQFIDTTVTEAPAVKISLTPDASVPPNQQLQTAPQPLQPAPNPQPAVGNAPEQGRRGRRQGNR